MRAGFATRTGFQGWEGNFYLDPPQPIEKPRFGRIKPNKTKLFYLDLLGRAWFCLFLFGDDSRAGCIRNLGGVRRLGPPGKGPGGIDRDVGGARNPRI
jgi:hypothetical protein